MKISFCITTYNRIGDLKTALDSILQQDGLGEITYELIVSDDSTNSDTENYVRSLSEKYPSVKYLKNKVKGQFNNLNNVIEHANYEWLVFLHDDDILNRDYLSKIIEAFSCVDPKDISIVWGARNLINEKGEIFNTLSSLKSDKDEVVKVNNTDYLSQMLLRGDYTYRGLTVFPMVTGLMIKKDLAHKIMFDARFYVNADGLFLWKVFFKSKKSLFINSPIVRYRWVDNSERARPSEDGVVFREMKGILLAMLDYMEQDMGLEAGQNYRKGSMENFYAQNTKISSPITWLSLRYKGSYFNRLKLILSIVIEVLTNYPKALIKPSFYVCIFLGLMPRYLLRFLYKYYMKDVI